MRGILVALFVGALATGQARAQGWESAVPRTHPYNIPTPLADDPSPFVHVPARLGFYTGLLAGLPPGILVGLPIALVERATQGQASQFTADVMQLPAVYAGVGMQYMVGGPFYLTKTVMWDIPRALLGGSSRSTGGRIIQRPPS